jgi:phosphoribosyl-AMP cyclohydrolase
VDCDVDALLIRVEALGPGVCHEGYRSCFFRRLSDAGAAEVVDERTFDPNAVYGRAQGPLGASPKKDAR